MTASTPSRTAPGQVDVRAERSGIVMQGGRRRPSTWCCNEPTTPADRVGMGSSSTPTFVTHDASFAAVLGAAPRIAQLVATDAHEGPVYVAEENALYFTTVPVANAQHVALKRVALESGDVGDVAAAATMANGMTLDHEGRLVICEQGDLDHPARLSRFDLGTGQLTTVIESFDGQPLNSPNDVAAAADGSLWFTDPSYGHLQDFRPQPVRADCVYRVDATGQATVVADGFDKPNGIVLSPDQSTLYVTDSGANQRAGSYHAKRPHHVEAFDIVDGDTLVNRRLFATISPGIPDGLKADADGRVYVSCATGVQVLSPDARLLGEIHLPGAVNFTFGGPHGNLLFITADTAVWTAELAVTGPSMNQRTKLSKGA
jgi:gluconolactonase